jgi:DUF1365 family protein
VTLQLTRSQLNGGPTSDTLTAPALYQTVVRHSRSKPLRHAFRYRHPMWLVDLDELPRGPLLGGVLRFEARDHLGETSRSIRDNVVNWARDQGVDVSDDRILMLANARSFGYVFNPLSVFWCLRRGVALDSPAALHCVVAEVHNTYGGRHAYLLVPDVGSTPETLRASVSKAFYVSPFNPVDGEYDMRFSLPTDDVLVTITLRRAGQIVFGASLTGRRQSASPIRVFAALCRHPMASLRVSILIRYQGIRLFVRGLPVIRRPSDKTSRTGVR